MHRTQIYLEDSQAVRLDRRAVEKGTSRSTLIRQAVDEYLMQEEAAGAAWKGRWKKAVEGTAGIAPYLEEGSEYVESLRRVDAERLSGLET